MLLLATLLLASSAVMADEPAQRPPNRLAKESSPYLLLHAHNPVDWYPWGPEAFERAKKEDKPIFLSIGYSSCYWCHVLERESFQDEEVAAFLNEHFVCVKVDREERPDVDQVYMTALQAYSGGGGWPMSMFLAPDGRPFFGGTYFPREPRAGMPGFLQLSEAIAKAWAEQRPEVEQSADQLTAVVRRASAGRPALEAVPLEVELAEGGLKALAATFDPEFAGFGYDPDNPKKPKFPEPGNLIYLLDLARRGVGADDGPTAPLAMVRATLDRMARGGIRDHLGGGYHRYSTDRRWAVPHFEKMLYDNALLLQAHALAFERDGDPRWKAEAEATAAFVARELTGPDGLFFSALDAESEAEEGKSYVWTGDEIRAVLADEYAAFAAAYGLDDAPNFEADRHVLHLPAALDPASDARLAPLRAMLLDFRSKRPAPLRDEKSLTAWNGLMIAGLAEGARVFGDESMKKAAEKAGLAVLATLRSSDGRLLRTARDGKGKLAAYLEDYAFLVHGFLRLHAATDDPAWLGEARGLTDRMIADFADDQVGGFFFTADDHETLLARTKDPYDGAIPSPIAVAARNLVALGRLTGEAAYLDCARETLEAFAAVMRDAPSATPTMMLALDEFLDERAPTFTNGGIPPADAKAATSAGVVEVAIETPEDVAAGKNADLKVVLTIREGWHLNANPAGAPSLVPTTVRLGPGAEAELIEVTYPESRDLKLAGQEAPIKVYEGAVEIGVRVKVADDAPAGSIELPLTIRVQACDDRACLAPATIEQQVPLTVTRD